MLDAMTQINLGDLTDERARSISGHERGVAARKTFCLDDLDKEVDAIDVVVPDYVQAIATSFIQGMFSKSVQRFGSKDRFLEHYRFVAEPFVVEQIVRSVERSLTRRGGAAFEK